MTAKQLKFGNEAREKMLEGATVLAKAVKAVASQTSDIAGDGTTTATVLAESIFREGLKGVAAGMNPKNAICCCLRLSRPETSTQQ